MVTEAGTIPEIVLHGVEKRFRGGAPVLQGYGTSEAPAIALNPVPPAVNKLVSRIKELEEEVEKLKKGDAS